MTLTNRVCMFIVWACVAVQMLVVWDKPETNIGWLVFNLIIAVLTSVVALIQAKYYPR